MRRRRSACEMPPCGFFLQSPQQARSRRHGKATYRVPPFPWAGYASRVTSMLALDGPAGSSSSGTKYSACGTATSSQSSSSSLSPEKLLANSAVSCIDVVVTTQPVGAARTDAYFVFASPNLTHIRVHTCSLVSFCCMSKMIPCRSHAALRRFLLSQLLSKINHPSIRELKPCIFSCQHAASNAYRRVPNQDVRPASRHRRHLAGEIPTVTRSISSC